jgi:hypothetical protein
MDGPQQRIEPITSLQMTQETFMRTISFFRTGISVASLALVSLAQAQTLVVTAEAPGVQSSQVTGITTETFTTQTVGTKSSLTSPIGTYTTSIGFNIDPADVFGGAGGTGNYITVQGKTGQKSMTLNLIGPQSYFGFWWSAADAGNQAQFYSGATLLGSFNSATALGALSNAYLGNPNSGGNTAEKYAYLNFIGTNGTTFDKIVFSQTTTIGGFESDNHSVRTAPLTPPFPGTVINGGFTAVPEPGNVSMLAGIGLSGIGLLLRRRRK